MSNRFKERKNCSCCVFFLLFHYISFLICFAEWKARAQFQVDCVRVLQMRPSEPKAANQKQKGKFECLSQLFLFSLSSAFIHILIFVNSYAKYFPSRLHYTTSRCQMWSLFGDCKRQLYLIPFSQWMKSIVLWSDLFCVCALVLSFFIARDSIIFRVYHIHQMVRVGAADSIHTQSHTKWHNIYNQFVCINMQIFRHTK